MSFLEVVPNNTSAYLGDESVLSLKSDANTDIAIADRPVFGVTITIKDDLFNMVNKVISPDIVIGWVNYAQLSKLGCTNEHQYFDVQDYMINHKNQLCFNQPVKLISVESKLGKSKEILRFVTVS